MPSGTVSNVKSIESALSFFSFQRLLFPHERNLLLLVTFVILIVIVIVSSSISIIIIMRFLPFVPLPMIFVAIAMSENLFSNPAPDELSTFQDSPQDLLASLNLLDDSQMTIDNNDDLFDDLDTQDLFSIEDQDPATVSSSMEVASCSTEGGQLLNRLRSRDGVSCPAYSNPVPLKKETPTQNNIGDLIRKVNTIFFDPDPLPVPAEPEQEDPLKSPEGSKRDKCRPEFPKHLCCNYREGPIDTESASDLTFQFLIYGNLFSCYQGI